MAPPLSAPSLPEPLLSGVSSGTPWLALLALGVSAALFVLGVGGNAAVLLWGVREPGGGPPRGVTAALLAALSAALGIFSMGALPAAVAAETALVADEGRRVIYAALSYCEAFVLGLSTFTLCALAMERMRAAFLPSHRGTAETWASIVGKIGIIWAGAALLALPELLLPPLVTLGRHPSEPPTRLIAPSPSDVLAQAAGVPSVPPWLAGNLASDLSSTSAPWANRPRREATFGVSPAPELRRRFTGETQPGEIRPGEIQPSEARLGEARLGEIRPGETRPGEIQPGEASHVDTHQRWAAADVVESLSAAYEGSRIWWIFGCHFCLPLLFSASCSALAACRVRRAGKGRLFASTRRQAQTEGRLHALLLSLAIVHGVCVAPKVFVDVAAPGRVPSFTGWLAAIGRGLVFCEASAVPAVVMLLRWQEALSVRAMIRGALVQGETPGPVTSAKGGQTRIHFRMMRAESIQSTSV